MSSVIRKAFPRNVPFVLGETSFRYQCGAEEHKEREQESKPPMGAGCSICHGRRHIHKLCLEYYTNFIEDHDHA